MTIVFTSLWWLPLTIWIVVTFNQVGVSADIIDRSFVLEDNYWHAKKTMQSASQAPQIAKIVKLSVDLAPYDMQVWWKLIRDCNLHIVFEIVHARGNLPCLKQRMDFLINLTDRCDSVIEFKSRDFNLMVKINSELWADQIPIEPRRLL